MNFDRSIDMHLKNDKHYLYKLKKDIEDAYEKYKDIYDDKIISFCSSCSDIIFYGKFNPYNIREEDFEKVVVKSQTEKCWNGVDYKSSDYYYIDPEKHPDFVKYTLGKVKKLRDVIEI